MMRKSDFEEDLALLLNRYSAENESNTPDYVLATFLLGCIESFNTATNMRDNWWGSKLKIEEKK